ncbi:MAG: transcriptional regulator [Alphaproteobacteria bacterium]|nr:transcriptional regulator [Alphaproteobacteria bacterium]
MALTRDFKETIVERAKRDKKFRRGMLMRGIALIIAGNTDDVQTGKSFIRDYINATIGFANLSKRTSIPKESLMRMLGPSGNPSLNNLNQVTHALLASEGVKEADSLKVSVQS